MSDSEKPLDHYSFDSYLKKQNLEVKRSTISGYGLHSRKSISKGTTILRTFPICSVPYDEYRSTICNYCFLYKKLKNCSKCKILKYCDKQCQFADWSIHKYECNVMSALNIKHLSCEELLLCRIVRLLGNKTCDLNYSSLTLLNDQYASSKSSLSGTIDDFIHMDEINAKNDTANNQPASSNNKPQYYNDEFVMNQKEFEFQYEAETIQNYYDEEDELYKKIDEKHIKYQPMGKNYNIYHLRKRIEKYKIIIRNEIQKPIGEGIYPLLGSLNHSCTPNCCLIFNGNEAILRSISDIHEGDELTIAYIHPSRMTMMRRLQLFNMYGFTCRCPRCSSTNNPEDKQIYSVSCTNKKCASKANCVPVLYDPNQFPLEYTCTQCNTRQQVNALSLPAIPLSRTQYFLPLEINENDPEQTIESLEQLVVQMKNAYVPIYSELIASQLQLYTLYLHFQNYEKALSLILPLLQTLESVYYSYDPTRGIIYYTIGLLYIKTKHYSESKQFFEKALSIFEITHGNNTYPGCLTNKIKNLSSIEEKNIELLNDLIQEILLTNLF